MGIVAWWILQSNEKEYSIQDIETISQQNQNTENYNPEVEGNTGATPQQRNENIEAPSTTNQFEYINEKRGNYEVDIKGAMPTTSSRYLCYNLRHTFKVEEIPFKTDVFYVLAI